MLKVKPRSTVITFSLSHRVISPTEVEISLIKESLRCERELIPLHKDTLKAASDINHWWQSREYMRIRSLEAEPSSLVLTNIIPSNILSQLSIEKYLRHDSTIVVTRNCLLLAIKLRHNTTRRRSSSGDEETGREIYSPKVLWAVVFTQLVGNFRTNAFGCFISWSFLRPGAMP